MHIGQASATDGDNIFVTGALEACQETFSTANNDDSTPFLCIPFVSMEFVDTFEAMAVTADSAFSDIYLAFMVDESDSTFTNNTYSVLGAFGTGTECIARFEDEDS